MKVDLSHINHVFFLGIGGIGMSAIARYFKQIGLTVSGYDKTPTPLTDQLIQEGMIVRFDATVDALPPQVDLVVYTPAIKEHPAFDFYKQKGVPIKKRAEVLGWIASEGKTVAVAGTHGKTTTSTLIAHIFHTAGLNFHAFLGGISKNYNTNYISNHPATHTLNPDYSVVEADEYDKSFLHLHPYAALITSTDADHLDIYGKVDEMKLSFNAFAGQVSHSLIQKVHLAIEPLYGNPESLFSYDVETNADYHATNLRVEKGHYLFDLTTPHGIIHDVSVGIPGRFNVENAIGAAAIADQCGIDHAFIKLALKTYQGVTRRFDFHIRREEFVYMDDYAHHPEELKACIRAVKEIYPTKKITGIFQPHLFSRTRDFADDFATSLDLLDEVILLDIYPAREHPIPGVDSQLILSKMKASAKMVCPREELLDVLKSRSLEVLLTLGAGDIDQFIHPITQLFKES